MAKKQEPKTENMGKPSRESQALRIFKRKCEMAMANIPNVQKFKDSDKMVDYVFKVGRELFDTPLDTFNTERLIRTGGRLTGVYAYLGQQSAVARAERDVCLQKANEVEKEILVELTKGNRYKLHEARARAEIEVSELNDIVVVKDISKNQWENITEAVDKMVSFIQSAIKVKEGERFQNSRGLRDNMG